MDIKIGMIQRGNAVIQKCRLKTLGGTVNIYGILELVNISFSIEASDASLSCM